MFGQDVMSNPAPVPATADREQAHNPDSRAFGALDASPTLVSTSNTTEVTLRTGDDTRGQVASLAYRSPAVARATHVLASRPSAMNCKRTWLSLVDGAATRVDACVAAGWDEVAERAVGHLWRLLLCQRSNAASCPALALSCSSWR